VDLNLPNGRPASGTYPTSQRPSSGWPAQYVCQTRATAPGLSESAARSVDPRAGRRSGGPVLGLVLAGVLLRYEAPKSGTVIEPSRPSEKPGL
jgi:hypothetical protein